MLLLLLLLLLLPLPLTTAALCTCPLSPEPLKRRKCAQTRRIVPTAQAEGEEGDTAATSPLVVHLALVYH